MSLPIVNVDIYENNTNYRCRKEIFLCRNSGVIMENTYGSSKSLIRRIAEIALYGFLAIVTLGQVKRLSYFH